MAKTNEEEPNKRSKVHFSEPLSIDLTKSGRTVSRKRKAEDELETKLIKKKHRTYSSLEIDVTDQKRAVSEKAKTKVTPIPESEEKDMSWESWQVTNEWTEESERMEEPEKEGANNDEETAKKNNFSMMRTERKMKMKSLP